MITYQQARQILEIKQKIQNTPELQKKKEEFFKWLYVNFCDYGNPTKQGDYIFKVINYNPKLKCFEMWAVEGGEPVKNYNSNNPNTRTKVNSETCLETDKIPDIKKAFSFIEEIANSLIRNKYHFFIWYAEGQRSPHIRIYDFEELQELNPQQRIKAQIEFWKRFVPFGMFHLIDTGILIDEHYIQLEYAPHWKYGTTFNLLFEYKPEKEIKQKKETKELKAGFEKLTESVEILKELSKLIPEIKLSEKAISLLGNNKINWIPREKNNFADDLTKNALKKFRSKKCSI